MIEDKEKFLEVMYQLYKNVGPVGCAPLEDYIEHILKGLGETDGMEGVAPFFANKRRDVYEEMFRKGDLFIFFGSKELMDEVNLYIEGKENENGCCDSSGRIGVACCKNN
jgi:hypothetical protein